MTAILEASKLLELAKSAHDKRQDDQAAFCIQLSIAESLLSIADQLSTIANSLNSLQQITERMNQ